jgi:hypothetical protein
MTVVEPGITQESAAAQSRDGRTFTVTGTASRTLLVGDVVVLATNGGECYLGQLREQAGPVGDRELGHGVLVARLGEDGAPARAAFAPFDAAALEPATAAHLAALQQSAGAGLPVGTWRSGDAEVPARLRAQGFGRHTFLCGQSGSGKTYALGVVLEQLLLHTELRMVVLDPNADFVHLGRVRPDAPPAVADRLEGTDIRVLGAAGSGAAPLRMRFATMPTHARAAVLRLDPLADRGEYNEFLHLMEDTGPQEVATVVGRLTAGGAEQRSLAQRIENLGMLDWRSWARDDPSAAEVVAGGARLTVCDLSRFRTPDESLAVTLDLLETLWTQRETRTPTLIVVDEAHNICPSHPSSPLEHALVARLTQIAAEGRKYGLWLLLSTQRPSKIDAQVLSQCDNLMLMRMNSPADLAQLKEAFGFAPAAMLWSSQFFSQGEAVVAGSFVPVPSVIRMGARLTLEGGGDVSVPVA